MLLKTSQVCELLAIAPNTVKSLILRGDLPAIKIGCQYRFRPSDISDYVRRQSINATTTTTDDNN